MEGKFVSYLRVSTDRQGRSGLGEEAQRQAVRDYLNGGSWDLLAEYREVESGKDNHRPELASALAHCRRTGAMLIVAKLDRLSRNLAFLAALMDSDVEFLAVDNPHANRFTLHILAAVAEHERGQISARTKAALAAAKARGTVLGGFRGYRPDAAAAEHARAAATEAADSRAHELAPVVQTMRRDGLSLAQCAAKLAQDGIRTPRGGQWTPTAVSNVLKRSA